MRRACLGYCRFGAGRCLACIVIVCRLTDVKDLPVEWLKVRLTAVVGAPSPLSAAEDSRQSHPLKADSDSRLALTFRFVRPRGFCPGSLVL